MSSLEGSPEPGQDDLNYDDWYIDDSQEPTVPPHEIILPCFPTLSDGLYHLILASVSLCTLLFLCFLVRRQKLCTSFCWGVPGVLSPLNLLEGSGNNWVPCAAFGLLFSSIFRMLLDPTALNFFPYSDGPHKELWKILALFYYPALYYPLLASFSVQRIPGYIVGTILSWMHCGALIWQKVECPQTPQFYSYYSLLATVPQICCLILLSIIYPTLLLQKLRQPSHSKQMSERNYYLKYLKKLLRRKASKTSKDSVSIGSQVSLNLCSYLCSSNTGFRLSQRSLLAATVSVLSAYQVALLLLVGFLPTVKKIRSSIDGEFILMLAGFGVNVDEDKKKAVDYIVYYIWTVEEVLDINDKDGSPIIEQHIHRVRPQGKVPGLVRFKRYRIPSDNTLRSASSLSYLQSYVLFVLIVCYIAAIVMSCAVTVTMLLRSLVKHRWALQSLCAGKVTQVFLKPRSLHPSPPALASWMSHISYQAAVTCTGLILQHVILFLVHLIVTFLIIIPIAYGKFQIILPILERTWPFWLLLLLVTIVQHLCTRFIFLQGSPWQTTNRRVLFLFTYIFLPVNILRGGLLAIARLVVSLTFNVVHFCRLDLSLLQHSVQSWDPGYRNYCNFLLLEVTECHPLVTAFCLLLKPPCWKKPDLEEGIHLMPADGRSAKGARSHLARARWGLAYTLIHNPSLVSRRGSRTINGGSPPCSK